MKTKLVALLSLLSIVALANNETNKHNNDQFPSGSRFRAVKVEPATFKSVGHYLEYKKKLVFEGKIAAAAYVRAEQQLAVDDYLLLSGGTMTGTLTTPSLFVTGNAGIGTTSAAYRLTVAGGDIKAYNFDNNTGITIGAENTQRPRIGFHVSDNDRRFKIEVNDVNSSSERLGFFSDAGGAWSPEHEVVSINKYGKVGISNTLPMASLDMGSALTQSDYHFPLFWYNDNNSSVWHGTKGGILLDQFGLPNNTTLSFGTSSANDGTFMIASKNTAVNEASSLISRLTVRGQSGNVGIGTTSPADKLHILMNGSTNGTGLSIGAVNTGGTGSQPAVAYLDPSGSKRWAAGLDVSSDIYQLVDASGNTRLSVKQDGNVDISNQLSVTGPTKIHSLDVTGTGRFSRDNMWPYTESTISLSENTGSAGLGNRASISFHNSFNAEGTIELSTNPGFRSIRFLDHQGYNLGIDVSGNAKFDQKLRIGTGDFSGNYSLAVEGTIGARKIKVTQGSWADYVFKPNYKLKPLVEVEKYIIKYRHLPGVPKEAEVLGKDMDISETQVMLLKKIEELTLYIIEQNKKGTEQEKRTKEMALYITEQNKKSKEQADKLKSLEEKLNKLLADKK